MLKIVRFLLQFALLLSLFACITAPNQVKETTTEQQPSLTDTSLTTGIATQSPVEPTVLPSPAATTAPISVAQTEATMKEFLSAWASYDPDKISAFYADDVKSYDATAGGVPFSKGDIIGVLHSGHLKSDFDVKLNSFFVSDDGHFAATIGAFTERDTSGEMIPKPYVSLLEFRGNEIIWVYDYYGGWLSETFPLQSFPPSANQPAESKKVDKVRSTIEKWTAAYNARDVESFLSFYSDQAEIIDVIAPEWRTLTKKTLEQDVTPKFNSDKFKSNLDTNFISADGSFVAVQGIYKDAKTVKTPMVIILEVENGLIIKQTDYLIYKEVF